MPPDESLPASAACMYLQVDTHKKNDPAVLAVFKSAKDPEFKVYEKAAGDLWSDYDFAHTFDASLVEEVSTQIVQTLQTSQRLYSSAA